MHLVDMADEMTANATCDVLVNEKDFVVGSGEIQSMQLQTPLITSHYLYNQYNL
jgi:hypothetical protein